MLSAPEAPEFEHPSSVLFFRVADLDGPYATLVERGVACDDQSRLITTMPDHPPGDGAGLSSVSQTPPLW
jgi:methylmalonyl-CoA/ethylmalonyl-CoA epimerase